MHTAQRFSGRFTVFFVPLIPLYGQYQVVCNVCGSKHKALGVLRQQLEALERTGAIPTGLLLKAGDQAVCPHCQHEGAPRVERRVSTGAWVSSGCLLFLCLPLFWIPLVMRSLKNESYKCAACGRDLTT